MPRLDEIAQLNHALVVNARKRGIDRGVVQLNARQVQFGLGLGQFALQANQLIGGHQLAFAQPFSRADIGSALAHIGFTLGDLGRAVVGREAQQALALFDRIPFVLIQTVYGAADLCAQLDPAPGFYLALHHMLALHGFGLQPLHLNLGQVLFGRGVVRAGGFLRFEHATAKQPQQQGQADGNGNQPGAFGQRTEHAGFTHGERGEQAGWRPEHAGRQ